MSTTSTEIRVQGKTFCVPAAHVDGQIIAITGRCLKIAAIRDEAVVEGNGVNVPERFIEQLRLSNLRPDIFTFSQRLPETTPRFSYPFEWDNVAAIPITTYEDWWKRSIKDKTRNMVRKAEKQGVSVRYVTLDDDLVRAIMVIYKESPIRQGRRFWHYDKDFTTIKEELSTYLERAQFIGAYWEDQLIGFMKLVRVDHCATLFHFLSLNAHRNKSPMNALLAKAVEYCAQEGIQYLTYGRFVYGNKSSSPLADFKRHNGFVRFDLPVYWVPLTLVGRIGVRLKLYRRLIEMVPPGVVATLLKIRRKILDWTTASPGDVQKK